MYIGRKLHNKVPVSNKEMTKQSQVKVKPFQYVDLVGGGEGGNQGPKRDTKVCS